MLYKTMRQKHLIQFFIGLVIILLANAAVSQFFFRWDLTEEGRYSITTPTKNILHGLEDEVVVKVYLEGDFPPGFKRLQKAIRETLDEFQIYGNDKIKYQFIDPSIAKNATERKKNYENLVKMGLPPTQLFAKEGDKKVEKLLFPGAVLYYKNFELPVLLFKNINQRTQNAPSPEQILNQSVENVEYNLISAIRQLTQKQRHRIGFLEGHGELDDLEKYDIVNTLKQYYDVYKVDLPKSEAIEGLDAILVAKPDSAYSEADKYKIDQFIMRGGKAIFCMDAVGVYLDSVFRDKGSFTFPYEHNLTELLFRYGVRLNNVLIQDLNSGMIPLVTGNMGNQPNIQPMPWKYHPLINTFGKHPIVKNMGAIHLKFVSTIDTVRAVGIQKTPLLFTSPYTKTLGTPYLVTFNEARKDVQNPNLKEYNKGSLPVAYLLEGAFSSWFKIHSFSQRKDFVGQSKPTKILVCADGDILRNDINPKTRQATSLDRDAFFGTPYSNKDFIMNALDYMIDDKGTILAKQKQITLRPLDKIKLQNDRLFWQVFNMLVPVLIVLLFGILFSFLRKRAYTSKA